MTLILTGSDVAGLLDADELPRALRSGFLAQAQAPAPAVLRDVRPAAFGDVLAGRHPGRSGSAELTVYAPVSLPWQGLAATWIAYRAATARGRGLAVDLLA